MKRDLTDDVEDDESDDDSDAKRPRGGGGGFGFSDTALDGPSADAELELMLAASSDGAPKGGSGGKGMHSGMGGGVGPDSFGGKGGTNVKIPGEAQVETTPMDFSRLSRELPSQTVPVPKELVAALMTAEHRHILSEESGADIEFAADAKAVNVRGSAEQVKRATRLLQRVVTHCHWGRSEAKVTRLLRPVMVESAVCRLSPMNTLRPAKKTLNVGSPVLSIGKDKGNDLCINDPIISRQHCVLELDTERGSVYAIDCSTNGTFLNGIRMPSKTVGKVLISHGDELLFKDPATGDQEFGYIVNLQELSQKAGTRLQAPRRILGPDETGNPGREFS